MFEILRNHHPNHTLKRKEKIRKECPSVASLVQYAHTLLKDKV